MKNIIASIAVFTLILSTGAVAYADSSAITPDQCSVATNHRVFDTDNSTIVKCIPNATWDAAMSASQVQQNGVILPAVARGASVTDEHGITDTCSNYWACVDISRTDSYRAQLTNIAKILNAMVAQGTVLSTHRFDGWMAAFK